MPKSTMTRLPTVPTSFRCKTYTGKKNILILSKKDNIYSSPTLLRLFPKIKVVAELTKASNIRFMKFRAKEVKQFGLLISTISTPSLIEKKMLKDDT